MDIPLVHLVITLEFAGGEIPPHGLFTLKKSFPAAFRRVVGCLRADGGCGAGPDCPCRAAFEQRLTPDPAALRRYQKPPLPFAFRIPVLPAWIKPESSAELSLILVGDATNWLEIYLSAINALFATTGRNPFNMCCRKIEAVAGDGSRIILQSGGGAADISSIPLLSFAESVAAGCPGSDTVTLKLQTPLRLLHQGVPLGELPFHALAGALFRRVSSLAYYYGGVELPCDFKWLAERSRLVKCSHSELVRVNRGGGAQGIEGVVTYRGELDEFIPFLSLGTLLNVGKGAAYGMGNYRLVCS